MIRPIFLIAFMLNAIYVFSQNLYPVKSIPQSLLSRAGAVVRDSKTEIIISDLDDVTYRHKQIISILNESGKDEANLHLYYDKTKSIKSVKGIIYNADGMPIAKITEKNFQDRSAVSDYSLYADDRVKYFVPNISAYPFTVEYEYEIRSRQSMYFPTWMPINGSNVSVEHASLSFTCTSDYTLRTKACNFSGKSEEKTEGSLKKYTWEVEHLAALRDEPYSPPAEDFLPMIKLAPEKFAFRNVRGSMKDWQEFGKWFHDNLLSDRNALPEATKTIIRDLLKDLADPKDKAKKIYRFMQEKSRYISVQIGIGGFQPYPAEEVDRLSYGDCKGLVNYTQALLKVAGIDSYFTIVYGGSGRLDIDPDFTSIQGNHAILCLPFKNDTTWLECTSKSAPFGYLGDFTDNRTVLVCKPEGGVIMRTPRFAAAESKQLRTGTLRITADGTIEGQISTSFTGVQYENHESLIDEPLTEQKKRLVKIYPLSNLDIINYKITGDKSDKPEVKETLELKAINYGSILDEKLKLKLNAFNSMRPIKEVRNRRNNVVINRGYYDEDVIAYQLPEGFKSDLPSKTINIEKQFGKYSVNVTTAGNKLVYTRKMLLKDGKYKAEEYQGLVDFFNEIAEADGLGVYLSRI